MPYLDVDVLYAHIKPEGRLKQASERVLAKVRNKQLSVYTNLISIIELQIISQRDFDRTFSQDILKKLQEIHELRLMPLTRDVMEAANKLRTSYDSLGVFDSFHAANAYLSDKKILSTDTIYDQIEGLERIDPRTFYKGRPA